MSAMDETIRCTYCLEELKYLIEPKRLDCGHVFCKECMSPQILGDGSFQCPTCRRVYENIDLESLVPALTGEGSLSDDSPPAKTAKEEEPAICCDKCNEKETPATGYCERCCVKMCTKHFEHHDGFFGTDHSTMDIAKYVTKMNSFNKILVCENHRREPINMACKKCYHYNCMQCDEDGSSAYCNGLLSDHIYLPLKKVEKEIRSEFDNLLRRSSEKLDETQQDCNRMIAEVEKKAEDQIQLIRTQSVALMDEIRQYEQEKTEKVLQYLEQLMTKKEEIDDVRVSAHKFLGNIHIRELISKKKEKCDEIQRVNNTDLGTCDWQNKQLRIGQKRHLEIQFWVPKHLNNHVNRGYGPPDFFPAYTIPPWNYD